MNGTEVYVVYCFVEIQNNRFERTTILKEDQSLVIEDAIKNTRKILETHASLAYVQDALKDFDVWSKMAKTGGEMITRNLHTAERFCRGFLFEFKTYLDHMQTMLSHTYGKESQALTLFKNGTHDAYDNSPEYAFTYQLRNYAQHCENVVHSAGGNQCDVGVKPTSHSAKLLSEYKGWKDDEKQFISQRTAIDLLETFKKTYNALSYVHTPVIQYMLDHDNVSTDISYLRKWADWLTQTCDVHKEDIWYWHFAHILHNDGSEFTEKDYGNDDGNRKYEVRVIDWGSLYALSDSLKPRI